MSNRKRERALRRDSSPVWIDALGHMHRYKENGTMRGRPERRDKSTTWIDALGHMHRWDKYE